MPGVTRFGICLEKELLKALDRFVEEGGFANRSQGIRSLIRDKLVQKEWLAGKEIAGAITLVYDHTKRELARKLTSVQHNFHDIVISSQHVHLDHNNCLEIVVVKGRPKKVARLLSALKSTKGVKHSGLTMTTTGSEIP
jgi:CopG family nickel-responsive transcriptional regulator